MGARPCCTIIESYEADPRIVISGIRAIVAPENPGHDGARLDFVVVLLRA